MSNESKTPRTTLTPKQEASIDAVVKIITRLNQVELELATLQSRIEQSMSDRAKGLLHEKELLGRIERLMKAGDELHEASLSCGCNSCLIARAMWQEAKK